MVYENQEDLGECSDKIQEIKSDNSFHNIIIKSNDAVLLDLKEGDEVLLLNIRSPFIEKCKVSKVDEGDYRTFIKIPPTKNRPFFEETLVGFSDHHIATSEHHILFTGIDSFKEFRKRLFSISLDDCCEEVDDVDTFISTKEACQLTGYSRDLFSKKCEQYGINCKRLKNNRRFYSKKELELAIKKGLFDKYKIGNSPDALSVVEKNDELPFKLITDEDK